MKTICRRQLPDGSTKYVEMDLEEHGIILGIIKKNIKR